ncbi:MAG: 6-bladed beta-propeller [Acidobacteriota bacterium]|nr:6-bladed beta-propeller [Acidobacteriota bacterium]MDW3228460.1 6-bladed beta-propeller [Acidobacteriota bacterium]MDY0231951.1 6-bladed beta-propeller [Candidatus Saccharicenans sp.]
MKDIAAIYKSKMGGPLLGAPLFIWGIPLTGKFFTTFFLSLIISLGLLFLSTPDLQASTAQKKIVEKLIPLIEDSSLFYGQDQNYFFNSPSCLQVTDECIYVLDTSNHRLQIFDLNGKFLKSIGGPGQAPGEFNNPEGMFIDAKRNIIYVADTRNLRLQVLSLEGKVESTVNLNFPPVGVAVREEKIYLLAFPGNTLIRKEEPLVKIYRQDFSPAGAFFKPVKTDDLVMNIMANQLAFKMDRSGQLVCARKFALNQVQVYDHQDQLSHSFEIIYKGSSVAKPELNFKIKSDLDLTKIAFILADLAFDSENNYYFLAGITGRKADDQIDKEREIYKYSQQGKYLGTMVLPEQAILMAIGSDDSIYLIDSNYSLRKFRVKRNRQ